MGRRGDREKFNNSKQPSTNNHQPTTINCQDFKDCVGIIIPLPPNKREYILP